MTIDIDMPIDIHMPIDTHMARAILMQTHIHRIYFLVMFSDVFDSLVFLNGWHAKWGSPKLLYIIGWCLKLIN